MMRIVVHDFMFFGFHNRFAVLTLWFYDGEQALLFYYTLFLLRIMYLLVFSSGWFSCFVCRGSYGCSCIPPRLVFLSGWGVAPFESLNNIMLPVERRQVNTNFFCMAASCAQVSWFIWLYDAYPFALFDVFQVPYPILCFYALETNLDGLI